MTITFVYFFLAAMLGHFVGDYVLQNQWMALNKSKKGWKYNIPCFIHVALYTLAIHFFTHGYLQPESQFLFLIAVFIPHYIIDRTSFANYILRLKNGYSLEDTVVKIPSASHKAGLVQDMWKIAFAAPVYIMNDNTLHFVCLWFTVKWFFS